MPDRIWGHLVIGSTIPSDPSVQVGTQWPDTANTVVKFCTDVSPITFVIPAPASHSHASHTGIGANDHHNQSHDHSAAGDATALVPESLEVTGGPVAFRGDISPAQITADQNNYNPTGLADAAVLRLSSDAARNITGLAGGADGRIIIIHNIGSFDIVLVDESASSTAANRFALNANVTISADQVAILQYDSTSSRWRAVAGGGGGGGGGAPTDAQYLTLALNATLTAERRLDIQTGITGVDGGADADLDLYLDIIDDFRFGVDQGSYGEWGWRILNFGGNGFAAGVYVAGNPHGVIRIRVGGAAGRGQVIYHTDANGDATDSPGSIRLADGDFIEFRLRSDVSTQIAHRMGICQSVTSDPPTNGYWFENDSGATAANWFAKVREASVEEGSVDTTIALDTSYHTYRIRRSGTNLEFLIDGTVRATVADTLGVNCFMFYHTITRDTANKEGRMDYIWRHARSARPTT